MEDINESKFNNILQGNLDMFIIVIPIPMPSLQNHISGLESEFNEKTI